MRFTILLLSGLLMILSSLSAQEIKKHEGKMFNGFNESGEVKYNYYEAEITREHIKHGNFRYALKIKEKDYRFYQNISGKYKDGSKTGLWTYKINQKDYELQKQNAFTSGTVELSSNYKDGVAHGQWIYESLLKDRKRTKKGNEYKWGAYSEPVQIRLELNFTNGTLTGPFFYSNPNYILSGELDDNGMMHGEWSWDYTDSVMVEVYSHGLLIKSELRDTLGNIVYTTNFESQQKLFAEYQKIASTDPAKLKDFSFRIDTLKILSNKNQPLTKLLLKTVFNHRYFLYRYVDGDKSFFWERSKGGYFINVKGLNKLEFKSSISSDHIKKYLRVTRIVNRMETQLYVTERMQTQGQLTNDAKESIKLMKLNMEKARRFSCMVSNIKFTATVAEGLSNSERECKYFQVKDPIDPPPYESRTKILVWFINELVKLEKDNQNQFNYIRRNCMKED